MQADELLEEMKAKMEIAVEALKKDYLRIRTGRANPAVLDNIRIDYFGNPTPINQLGNISVPEPQLIVISPWDKNMLTGIEKAIQKADIGITPQNDGKLIRLPIPPLTEERRKELVKLVKRSTEDYKNNIRNLRREANQGIKELEKAKKLSEDDSKKWQEQVQKGTDEFVHTLDELTHNKEQELMEF